MKMILVIGMSSSLGGVETFIMNYFRNIDGNKVHMDFLIYEEHCVYENEILERGSKIYKITASRYKQFFKFIKERKQLFEKLFGQYDCVWQNDCSLANAVDLKVAKRYGIGRRIFHIHCNQYMRNDKKKLFYKFLHQKNRVYIKYWATDYWACSLNAGEFAFHRNLIKSDSFKVIPNAIVMSDFYYNESVRTEYRTKYQVNRDCVVIGCVGRLHFQKNQNFLLDIFYEIRKKNHNTVLWLIGDGEDKAKLQEKVKSLELEQYVKFMGNRSDIHKLLQAMDLFVLPSIFEGFGIALLEAQVAGLKTFTSAKVVPENVRISDLIEYLSLSNSAQEWANIIMESIPYKRENMEFSLNDNEYNVKYSAEYLENELMK